MDSTLILHKTAKGQAEIKNRTFGLPQTLRSLLIMADGTHSLSALLRSGANVPKIEESVEWLIQEGFIEPTPGRRASVESTPIALDLPPKQALIATARELLGPDSPKVIQRLEEAQDTVPELMAALDRCHKFIKLTIDEKKADQFLKAGRALLG